MSLTLVTAPAVEPLTTTEVWDHLKVDLEGSPAAPVDASLIAALTSAATAWLDGPDGELGRCIVQQTWDYKMDCFPGEREYGGFLYEPLVRGGPIYVPLPPLRSVTSITYVDTNGDSQVLSSSLYTVDTASEPGRIVPAYGQTWPQTRDVIDAVTVRFVAGYAPVDSPLDYRANIPADMKAAMKLLIGHLYANRETVVIGATPSEVPFAANALIARYRMPRV